MRSSELKFPRLHVDSALDGNRLRLDDEAAHYLSRVLRLKVGRQIVVFNGRGRERLAEVESLARREPSLRLGEELEAVAEAALRIRLVQGLIKADAMDLVVQKVTELGVDSLTAVRSEFSVIKLDEARRERRLQHWQRIARSACEQSGRHRPPKIDVADALEAVIASLPAASTRIAFDRESTARLVELAMPSRDLCLAIGPEGGFSPAEIELLGKHGFLLLGLGPRTLRAETAALASCAIAQALWGDLA
jgi:16S rRNA (uracil1498-N3)-methyltransferase